mmetsp:Transcript_252/g.692  ORF Transcript_252/g.692 Transcript_252/m.692 type:complete len:234 (+) Transcript_252:1071-1772(+)
MTFPCSALYATSCLNMVFHRFFIPVSAVITPLLAIFTVRSQIRPFSLASSTRRRASSNSSSASAISRKDSSRASMAASRFWKARFSLGCCLNTFIQGRGGRMMASSSVDSPLSSFPSSLPLSLPYPTSSSPSSPLTPFATPFAPSTAALFSASTAAPFSFSASASSLSSSSSASSSSSYPALAWRSTSPLLTISSRGRFLPLLSSPLSRIRITASSALSVPPPSSFSIPLSSS